MASGLMTPGSTCRTSGSSFATSRSLGGTARLRKDKHKLSLYTPREEEMAAYRKAASVASEHAKKEKANAALLASKGLVSALAQAPAPAEAGGALAPLALLDKVVAAEETRVFAKEAIADACDRMQASGHFITMLFSSATSGADGKGSPPTHRSVRDAWDQPVRVSSIELATALGLEKEEYPAEELLEVQKEEAQEKEEAPEENAPAAAAAAKMGARERANAAIQAKLEQAKSFKGGKAPAASTASSPAPSAPGAVNEPRRLDPAERFRRTHIDYASFLNGSRSPKANQQQQRYAQQGAASTRDPFSKPGMHPPKPPPPAEKGKGRRKSMGGGGDDGDASLAPGAAVADAGGGDPAAASGKSAADGGGAKGKGGAKGRAGKAGAQAASPAATPPRKR